MPTAATADSAPAPERANVGERLPVVGGEDIRDDVVAVVAAQHIGLPADGDGDVIRPRLGQFADHGRGTVRRDGLHIRRTVLARPTTAEHEHRVAEPRAAASCTASASVPAGRLVPVLASTRTTAAVENFVASRPPSTTSSRSFVTTTSRATGAGSRHPASSDTHHTARAARRRLRLGRAWSRAVGVATPAATAQGHGEDDYADDPAPCTSHDSSLAVCARRARWRDASAGTQNPKPTSEGHVPIIVPIVAGERPQGSRRRGPPSRPSASSPNS